VHLLLIVILGVLIAHWIMGSARAIGNGIGCLLLIILLLALLGSHH
jgi:hypothetical protein